MIVATLFGVGGIVLLFLWARAVSGGYGAPRWIRFFPIAPAIVFGVLLARAIDGLRRLAGPPSDAGDPAMKARILAESISEAMNLILASFLVLVVSAVVLLLLTWRYRWSQKLPKAEGQPPYR